MTIPVLTPMSAGSVAQLSDMQALTSACTFLMGKPMARIHCVATGQSLPSGLNTALTFDTVDFDPDGMWSVSHNAQLTIQTPGFYKVRYGVSQNGVSGASAVFVVTGANNPAGSGVTAFWCEGFCYGGAPVGISPGASGIIGQYLYPADFVTITFAGNATSTTIAPGAFLTLEWVST
jgi:hypothetical protein